MTKKIRNIGKRIEGIIDISPKQRRIDPDEVAKALGAEKCTEIPERFRAAATHPLLSRRRKHDEGKEEG
jgi:hypothetical protein